MVNKIFTSLLLMMLMLGGAVASADEYSDTISVFKNAGESVSFRGGEGRQGNGLGAREPLWNLCETGCRRIEAIQGHQRLSNANHWGDGSVQVTLN